MEWLAAALPYIINVISGIVLAVCTYTINKARTEREKDRKDREEKEKALSDGVQALLRESIVSAYNKYTDKGFCPIYAKESIKKVYTAYHNLEGNDVATSLYQKLLTMPEDPPIEHGHRELIDLTDDGK